MLKKMTALNSSVVQKVRCRPSIHGQCRVAATLLSLNVTIVLFSVSIVVCIHVDCSCDMTTLKLYDVT